MPYGLIQGQGRGGPKVAEMADVKVNMHVIKKLTVNCDTPREYLNFETISVCSQPPRSTQPFIPPG